MPLILSGSAGLSGNVGNVTKDMMPAGSIIQVVSGSVSTNVDTTSTAGYGVDTGLMATITPNSAANKIMALVYTGVCDRPGAAAESMSFSLLRNGTEVQRATNFLYNSGSWPQQIRGAVSLVFMDAPASIAALTYKLTIRSRLGNNVSFNTNQDIATITLMEIKA